MKHIPHLFITSNETYSKQINEESTHHLVNVLRLKIDDFFTVSDNSGNLFKCKIDKINKKNLTYEIMETSFFDKPEIEISLIQGVTKFDTFEEILDKATQLGVTKIYPVFTDFCNISKDIYLKKQERFNKILKTASEQSQRVFLPELMPICSFEEVIEKLNNETTIVCYEKATIPLKNILRKVEVKKLNVFIGPEGGFSEKEISFFNSKQYPLVSISQNILRAETAVITAVSNIFYELI